MVKAKEKKDKDHKVEAKKLPHVKKRKTKHINHSARKTFNNHAKSTGATIILHGVEFKDRQTRAAWISLSGMNENKGFYTNPLNKAWRATLIDSDEPLPLYPDDVTCTQTMAELFCIDYWVSRRESPECCNTKKADPSKPWPYMAFLYIRPQIEDEENFKGESKWSLTEWLDHLAVQFQKFMSWTKCNPSHYDSYLYSAVIKVKSIHQTYPLAHEFLDETVVEVIRNLYDVQSIEEMKNDEVLKDTFFGESVSMEVYNVRVVNAWLNHIDTSGKAMLLNEP